MGDNITIVSERHQLPSVTLQAEPTSAAASGSCAIKLTISNKCYVYCNIYTFPGNVQPMRPKVSSSSQENWQVCTYRVFAKICHDSICFLEEPYQR